MCRLVILLAVASVHHAIVLTQSGLYAGNQASVQIELERHALAFTRSFDDVAKYSRYVCDTIIANEDRVTVPYNTTFDQLVRLALDPIWFDPLSPLTTSLPQGSPSYYTDSNPYRLSDVYFPEWAETDEYDWNCVINKYLNGSYFDSLMYPKIAGCTRPYDSHLDSYCKSHHEDCVSGPLCPVYCTNKARFNNSLHRFYYESTNILDNVLPPLLSNFKIVTRYSYCDTIGGVHATPCYCPDNVANYFGGGLFWNQVIASHPDLNPQLLTIYHRPYYDTVEQSAMITAGTPAVGRNGTYRGSIMVDIKLSKIRELVGRPKITKNSIVFVTTSRGEIILADQEAYDHIFCPDPMQSLCIGDTYDIVEQDSRFGNGTEPPTIIESRRNIGSFVLLDIINAEDQGIVVSPDKSEYWAWTRLNIPSISYTMVTILPRSDIEQAAIWSFDLSSVTLRRSNIDPSVVRVQNNGILPLRFVTESPIWLMVDPLDHTLYPNTTIDLHLSVSDTSTLYDDMFDTIYDKLFLVPQSGTGSTGYEQYFPRISIEVSMIVDALPGESISYSLRSSNMIVPFFISLAAGWLSCTLMGHDYAEHKSKYMRIAAGTMLARNRWLLSSTTIVVLCSIWSSTFLHISAIYIRSYEIEIDVGSFLLCLLPCYVIIFLFFLIFRRPHVGSTKGNYITNHTSSQVSQEALSLSADSSSDQDGGRMDKSIGRRADLKYIILMSVVLNLAILFSNLIALSSIYANITHNQKWEAVIGMLLLAVFLDTLLLYVLFLRTLPGSAELVHTIKTLCSTFLLIPSLCISAVSVSNLSIRSSTAVHDVSNITISPDVVFYITITISCIIIITLALLNITSLRASYDALDLILREIKKLNSDLLQKLEDVTNLYNTARRYVLTTNYIRPIPRFYAYMFLPKVSNEVVISSSRDTKRKITAINGIEDIDYPSIQETTDLMKITLEMVINHPVCLEIFKDFCVEERCIENIMFYLDIVRYESLDTPERAKMVDEIMSTYIEPPEDKGQVNVGGTIINQIKNNKSIDSKSRFTEAKVECYRMMNYGTFQNFLKDKARVKQCKDILKHKDRALVEVDNTVLRNKFFES